MVELVKAGATMELQEKIMELREAVLNAKDEVLSLREQLSELKRAAADRDQLTFDGKVYWREIAGNPKVGPFCQRCFDAESKIMRLQKCPQGVGADWICTQCKQAYGYQF